MNSGLPNDMYNRIDVHIIRTFIYRKLIRGLLYENRTMVRRMVSSDFTNSIYYRISMYSICTFIYRRLIRGLLYENRTMVRKR